MSGPNASLAPPTNAASEEGPQALTSLASRRSSQFTIVDPNEKQRRSVTDAQIEEKIDGTGAEEKYIKDTKAPGSPEPIAVQSSPEQAAAFPEGVKLYLILGGLYAAVFLVSLDQTIISPAIPNITNDFDALSDVGWYGSAYFLTSTALQPLFGKLYAMFSLKLIFMSAMSIFEVGSLICGVAQSSSMLIVGRAIAGCGVAGGYIGVLTIIAASAPLEKQPLYTGLMGAAYGMGGVIGPLVGGAFTSSVTWRWCFYVNLPLGAPILTAIFFLFSPPVRTTQFSDMSFRKKLTQIDWIGTTLIHGSVIALLLVLQWGGVRHEWDSSVIIGLIVGFALIAGVFVAEQAWMGDLATIPLRLLRNKTIVLASLINFCIGAVYFSVVYFVPIYFQTIKGSSAIISGVQTLPLILSCVASVMTAGVAVTKLGYYNPFIIVGGVLATVGSGLLFTWGRTSSAGAWIGYQIIVGIGAGLAFMQPFVAAQTVLAGSADLELGSAIVIFFQTLGGCFFVSISLSIYQNEFSSKLGSISGANVAEIVAAGVTGFRQFVPDAIFKPVVDASADSLDLAFVCPIALSGVWVVASIFLDWRSVKGQNISSAPVA